MRVLVIHQNFPGQFGHIARTWSLRPGWDVRALGANAAPGLRGFDKLTRYRVSRSVQPRQHHYLKQMEDSVLHGQASARAMLAMRKRGFTPEIILAHPGWGETLYAKDVYPDARLIHFCEWYYSAEGADFGFDPEFPLSFDDRARIRTWNAHHALNLVQCDAAVSPTHWQRSRFPEILRSKIMVQHEGIDTQALGPDPQAQLVTSSGVALKAGDPVITYVARNLEPYRGFHVFMRVLQQVQKCDPRCHALIVGGDQTSYGRGPHDAANWREKMLKEVTLDPARTHFLGRLPRQQYLRVLQVSAAHVYLTYPFVLSWSLLEAMACGTPIVASDTAPVREVLRDGSNSRLVDFFDINAISAGVLEMLSETSSNTQLRRRAQSDARAFGIEGCVAGYERLISGSPEVPRWRGASSGRP